MKILLLVLLTFFSIKSFSNEKMIGFEIGKSLLTNSDDNIGKEGSVLGIKGIYSVDTNQYVFDFGLGFIQNEIKGSDEIKSIKIITKSASIDFDTKYKFSERIYIGPMIRILGGTDTSFSNLSGNNSINSYFGIKGQYDFLNYEKINYRLESSLSTTMNNPKNVFFLIGLNIGFKETKLNARIEPPLRINEDSDLKITLKSARVLFENNVFDIDQDLKNKLIELSKFLIKNNDSWLRIKISGHTDNLGSFEYNKNLSQKRSDSIKNLLVGNGVSIDKIESVSFSYLRPIETNNTAEGRSKNRRTEIEFFGIKDRTYFNKEVVKILSE